MLVLCIQTVECSILGSETKFSAQSGNYQDFTLKQMKNISFHGHSILSLSREIFKSFK
jgi:hypothetical protein